MNTFTSKYSYLNPDVIKWCRGLCKNISVKNTNDLQKAPNDMDDIYSQIHFMALNNVWYFLAASTL